MSCRYCEQDFGLSGRVKRQRLLILGLSLALLAVALHRRDAVILDTSEQDCACTCKEIDG